MDEETGGGFVPPPGVETEEEELPPPASIAGVTFHDLDRDGVRDPGEPGIGNVLVTLGGDASMSTMSAPDGTYLFSQLAEGNYSVTAPAVADGKAILTAPTINVGLSKGEDRTNVDFGYVNGSISGFAYVDANLNGVFDGGESPLGGVPITLGGGPMVSTAPNGSFTFGGLDANTYAVAASAVASGYNLATASPLSVILSPGEDRANVNFGYARGHISGFAYLDANGNGARDAGESGLPGVTITLTGPQNNTTSTAGSGGYAFPDLLAGSYSVAAPPTAGAYTLSTSSPLSPIVGVGQNVADVNFGYQAAALPPPEFCSKQSVKDVLNPATGRYPNNLGLDTFVHTVQGASIQAAIVSASDSNGDGYIIVGVSAKAQIGELGGSVTENLVIDRVFPEPFALFACSVTVNDPVPGDEVPTGRISAAASVTNDPLHLGVYVMDVHASGSASAGWKIEGNGRYLRNIDARTNATGVWIVGNNNTVHNGSAESNTGIGILIQGNGNVVSDADVMSNGGDGIRVAGNNNQLLKNDIGEIGKGNGGDGINLVGTGNFLQENDAYSNAGDGLDVSGGTSSGVNTVVKNKAGDRNKGNGGDGLRIGGTGNGASNPVEIDENTVKSNGLIGVHVTGSGHQLRKNVSGGTATGENNAGCEFMAAAGNINTTGNKANGTTVAGSNGSAFPTTCVGTP
jgi:hypothetical protein